jgi:hypothetical protein
MFEACMMAASIGETSKSGVDKQQKGPPMLGRPSITFLVSIRRQTAQAEQKRAALRCASALPWAGTGKH